MKFEWKKGLDESQAKDIENVFKESVRLRKRLIKILEGRIDIANKELLDRRMFQIPNWELHQSERMGYINSLREVISLLE